VSDSGAARPTRKMRPGDAESRDSSDTPRGLGCRYVNRKAETAALKT
jgi:hypothetical protein